MKKWYLRVGLSFNMFGDGDHGCGDGDGRGFARWPGSDEGGGGTSGLDTGGPATRHVPTIYERPSKQSGD